MPKLGDFEHRLQIWLSCKRETIAMPASHGKDLLISESSLKFEPFFG